MKLSYVYILSMLCDKSGKAHFDLNLIGGPLRLVVAILLGDKKGWAGRRGLNPCVAVLWLYVVLVRGSTCALVVVVLLQPVLATYFYVLL